MKAISSKIAVCIVGMTIMVVLSKPWLVKAEVICSPIELAECPPMTAPSSICCRKVREQRPCLCGYLNDPNLKPTINSPSSRRIAASCGVLFPTCY
ncbi:hypothetical protein UlMin_022750 [Ulmus minor]